MAGALSCWFLVYVLSQVEIFECNQTPSSQAIEVKRKQDFRVL